MSKTVAFVFPYNVWGGAFRSTYKLADGLIDLGYSVDIIFPVIPPRSGYSRFSFPWAKAKFIGILKSLVKGTYIPVECNANIVLIPFISKFFLSKYDFVIGNHWNTIDDLYQCVGSSLIHFIRDIESWAFYFPQELAVFNLPIKRLAVSSWVADELTSKYNITVDSIIPNCINSDDFFISNRPFRAPKSVGLLISSLPVKGIQYALDAIKLIYNYDPSIKFIIFGSQRPGTDFDVPYSFYHIPVGDDLRRVYNSIDLFLFPSLQEGFGNPPLEAMAAQCAVISTKVGSLYDLGKHLHNVYFVEKASVDAIYHAVVTLLNDSLLFYDISQNGYHSVKSSDWASSSLLLSKFLSSHTQS